MRRNLSKDKFLKYRARRATRYAIRIGILKPLLKCELCSNSNNIQIHHIDYEKPENIKWLCRNCHIREHMKIRRIAEELDTTVDEMFK